MLGGKELTLQYTQKMIREVFIKKLSEYPLNKITVKSITEECQINRNTFYYYYSDIYELLSEIFQLEFKKVIDDYNENLSWEESFLLAAKYTLENKKAVYHIYNSLRREEVENYIYNIAGNVMTKYVSKIAEDIPVSSEDVKWIAYFYQCSLTGIILRWISSGMKEDPELIIRRIGQLFDGNIEISLKRSVELQNSQ